MTDTMKLNLRTGNGERAVIQMKKICVCVCDYIPTVHSTFVAFQAVKRLTANDAMRGDTTQVSSKSINV